MPFFRSLPDGSGPASVFTAYPHIYRLWSEMSQALMNGTSPLSQGERELILAYAAGVAGCKFVYVAHSEVAYAWGVEHGLLDRLLDDLETAPVKANLKPLLAFVRKLMVSPGEMSQADADAVFNAGWEEQALHDAIAVTARAAFMQRLVEGHGFTPMSRDAAAKRAQRRVERGYVNLYPAFRDTTGKEAG
jgi:alkylhydroperoxidase family enzyme